MPSIRDSAETLSIFLPALSGLNATVRHMRLVPVSINKENWKELLLVFLVLLLAGLALFQAIPHGNQLGRDEWAVAYTVSRGDSSYGEGRSFYPWLLWYPITGIDFRGNYYLYLLLRSGCSLLVYLIVRLYAKDRLFAVACGVISSTYIIGDEFFLEPYPLLNAYTAILLALIGLYLYLIHMRDYRPPALAAAVILAIASLIVYEIAIPLLVGVTVLLFILERNLEPYRLVGFSIWLAVLLAFLVAFMAPSLGIVSATYSSGMTVQPTLSGILWAALVQLAWGFAKPFVGLIRLSEWAEISAVVLPTVGIVLFGIHSLHGRLKCLNGEENHGNQSHLYYGMWTVIGLIITVLGFSPFLITIYATSNWRTHILAVYGEAITLVAGVWFASLLIRESKFRWPLRYLGLAALVMWGSYQTWQGQKEISSWNGTWKQQSVFLRSLAHQIPQIEENTLIILDQPPGAAEGPFLAGFAFQFAMQYLYEDRAMGFIPQDTLLRRSWEYTDTGILIAPIHPENTWVGLRPTTTYKWDEIIVIRMDSEGRAEVLEHLPASLYTPERDSLYDPQSRIVPDFVGSQFQANFAPILSTDSR